jgi:hypothetical protein
MKTWGAAVLVAGALLLVPTVASADERVGDAALGALSGVLVGGPIGAVAGGVIGFTAGPSISSAWFHPQRKPRPPRYVHHAPPQQW